MFNGKLIRSLESRLQELENRVLTKDSDIKVAKTRYYEDMVEYTDEWGWNTGRYHLRVLEEREGFNSHGLYMRHSVVLTYKEEELLRKNNAKIEKYKGV